MDYIHPFSLLPAHAEEQVLVRGGGLIAAVLAAETDTEHKSSE